MSEPLPPIVEPEKRITYFEALSMLNPEDHGFFAPIAPGPMCDHPKCPDPASHRDSFLEINACNSHLAEVWAPGDHEDPK